MNGPRRLIEQPGPSARLLRAAELHVPSERARRRALASAATATATLAVSGGSAALGGGSLLKSALTWLCVGVVGGTAVSVAATSMMSSPQSSVEAQPPAAVELRALGPANSSDAKDATTGEDERVEAVPSERHTERGLAGNQAAREPAPRDMPTANAALAASSAAAVLTFDGGAKPNPSLFEELRLIDAARSAAQRRDTGTVLSSLDRYDRSYPRGHFLPESLALRIETLSRVGDRAHARALAAQFRRDYPQHPLLTRVKVAAGD